MGGEGLSWEQAFQGTLAASREKEVELTTTSLEFEYLHQKKSMQNADCNWQR